MAKHHKKKRTHIVEHDPTIPQSIIIKQGKVGKKLQQLSRDFRKLMLPNTAQKLKEQRQNRIKDYLMVCGQLNVSHLLAFTLSEKQYSYLKIAKVPRGPTVTFRIKNYSLMKDIYKMQVRPKSYGSEYEHSPLVVLNNFPKTKEYQLVSKLLQNMFPAIKVNEIKINECRRVLLFNYNSDKDLIEQRHYLITTKTKTVSKVIKSLNSLNNSVPDLGMFNDISDFIKYLNN